MVTLAWGQFAFRSFLGGESLADQLALAEHGHHLVDTFFDRGSVSKEYQVGRGRRLIGCTCTGQTGEGAFDRFGVMATWVSLPAYF